MVWRWTKEDDRCVQQLKEILTSSTTLVHYDPDRQLVLATDASDRGLGAVLMHRFADGTERPIAYASRTLKDAETRYACIDKEALAIVFGVTKFHQYLYGRHFTLKTDHKPLERIFGEKREIPKLLNNRLVRWALTLSAYDYEIQYIQGISNAPADVLSRLPIQAHRSAEERLGAKYQLLNLKLEDLPVTKATLQKQTILDVTTAKVVAYLERGWPMDKKKLPPELHTFFEKREALSYEDKILLWQGRIVVPAKLRQGILKALHEGHPGAAAMKSLARFHVWWPNIDDQIEQFVRNCHACQENRPRQQEVPLFSWTVPTEPWSRIHIDYAGPFEGKSWLVIVDASTKWLEIKPTKDTSTTATIRLLRSVFAQFGLPRTIVSDNGSNFTSAEFKEFCDSNNIKHIRSTPYHAKTNGLAERAVRTFKERFTAAKESTADQDLRLQRFLISYRNTPHSTTGRSPAELMFGRRLRTRLDLLKPSVTDVINNSLAKQKYYHDRRSKPRSFFEGEEVWVQRTHGKGHEKGTVHRKTAEYSYIVNINGKLHRKHADQMRSANQTEQQSEDIEEPCFDMLPAEQVPQPVIITPAPEAPVQPYPPVEHTTPPVTAGQPEVIDHPTEEPAPSTVPEPVQVPAPTRREKQPLPPREKSTRTRKPVVKPYDEYLTGKKHK